MCEFFGCANFLDVRIFWICEWVDLEMCGLPNVHTIHELYLRLAGGLWGCQKTEEYLVKCVSLLCSPCVPKGRLAR